MDDQSRTSKLYVTGLKNAHAMEAQALSIMRPQVDRIKSYPEMAERLRQHIAETEGQVRRLEALLEDTGADKSTLKDAALSAAGTMAALGHTPAGDEILKNTFANFAFENYEIAAYSSLIALAEAAGEIDAISVLQQNLGEEQEMSDWLASNVEAVTQKFAQLEASGESGKR
jgi:ferritin-like metal-binding protein YciE